MTAFPLLLAQVLLNPPPAPSVISVDVNLVNVLATARDRSGAFVKDLRKEDFEVLEDGKRQAISLFARETDSPLTVALLLDMSGSVASIIGTEKAAAARFFSEVIRPGDQAMMVAFSNMIAVWQDLTPNAAHVSSALERAQPFVEGARGRGGTLLYDAVKLVASQKLRKQVGRKTMVLITDGHDIGSRINLEDAVRAAQEADAVIYAIHYQADSAFGSFVPVLRKLSEPTGGRTFNVGNSMPLDKVFDTIREEMRSQYAIGFTSSKAELDGTFRKLQLKVSRPGVKLQTRSGYYAVRR